MEGFRVPAADGVSLQVSGCGSGADVVALSGGPGCVNYLAAASTAPDGVRSWFPEPRGVGRSGGGPHDMTTAVADLESIRARLGIAQWVVLGHSWGSDLAVRYALDHPRQVKAVVGVAGHGLHEDRTWADAYHGAQRTEEDLGIDWNPDVHEALSGSFREWIHEPDLFRRLADSPVPMQFIAAADDIRPDWPLRQLAELVPSGSFQSVPGVDHNFWTTASSRWRQVVAEACLLAATAR